MHKYSFPAFMLLAIFPLFSTAGETACSDSQYDAHTGVFSICGKATAGNKSEARELALQNAKQEFALLCDGVPGCNKNFATLLNTKSRCSATESEHFVCYRELRYDIGIQAQSSQTAISTPPTPTPTP